MKNNPVLEVNAGTENTAPSRNVTETHFSLQKTCVFVQILRIRSALQSVSRIHYLVINTYWAILTKISYRDIRRHFCDAQYVS